jgi:hypothetical protein
MEEMMNPSWLSFHPPSIQDLPKSYLIKAKDIPITQEIPRD